MEFMKHAIFVLLPALALVVSPVQSNRRRHSQPRAQTCTTPPTEELEGQLSSAYDLHDTFYQFPPLRDSVMTLEEFERNHKHMVNVKYSNIDSASADCESPQTDSNSNPSRAKDPCPLRWRFSHDNSRVPSTLVEADCLQCDHCQHMYPEDFTMGCAPIRFFTKVLRRKSHCHPQTGHYVYEKVWEPLTIGCACRGGVKTKEEGQGQTGIIRPP